MTDEIVRGLGQGGPLVIVLALVLWGGYRLALRLVDRTLATLDVIAARVSQTGDAVVRVEAKLDDVAASVEAVRERTGRHKLVQ